MSFYVAKVVLAERERCINLVQSVPEHIPLDASEVEEYGFLVRPSNRNDIIAAIKGETT